MPPSTPGSKDFDKLCSFIVLQLHTLSVATASLQLLSESGWFEIDSKQQSSIVGSIRWLFEVIIQTISQHFLDPLAVGHLGRILSTMEGLFQLPSTSDLTYKFQRGFKMPPPRLILLNKATAFAVLLLGGAHTDNLAQLLSKKVLPLGRRSPFIFSFPPSFVLVSK